MISVYTDGSTKPTNPGPSGYSVVMVDDGEIISTASSYIGEATNNIAELNAVLYALKMLEQLGWEWEPIKIYSDSQYTIGLLSKNWNAKKNKELVAEIRAKLENFPNVTFEWVKAHNNDRFNELADKLAKSIIDTTKGA